MSFDLFKDNVRCVVMRERVCVCELDGVDVVEVIVVCAQQKKKNPQG
jgi:hypothetical protein